MRILRDLSIRRKLNLIAMLTSGVALLVACALAHHVRNAVTPLLGMAEMFDPGQSEDGERLKRVALQEGRRIAAVIDALMEVSETGDIPTVAYAGQASKQMLDLEPLIQRHLGKKGGGLPSASALARPL